MIGYIVGNYKITEKIGEGGMGEVYKGIDLMLERPVAIKVLRSELSRRSALVERFRAEAITLAKLNHPNIATLYSFTRQGDDLFMVMEYVQGYTFEQLIRQTGAIPVARAIELFAMALEGMAHAHRLGIIHRDVKPANLMLTHAGLVKVMDFGIARAMGSSRFTRSGNLIGTIEYMSPEQVRGEETDIRSDIYSLGILLYEMLTGRVPFQSNSEYELMRKQIDDAPIPPRTFAKQIPLALEQAIMRALAKRPEARFQTADEFRLTLLAGVKSASANVEEGKRSSSKVAGIQKAKNPKEKITTLVDGSKPPAPVIKETRLPDASEGVRETRLADEANRLKETRVASDNGSQGITGKTNHPMYWQSPVSPQLNTPLNVPLAVGVETNQKRSFRFSGLIKKWQPFNQQINKKYFVGAGLFTLLLIISFWFIPPLLLQSDSETVRQKGNANSSSAGRSREEKSAVTPTISEAGNGSVEAPKEEQTEKPIAIVDEAPAGKSETSKPATKRRERTVKPQPETKQEPNKTATKKDSNDDNDDKNDKKDEDKKAKKDKKKDGGVWGTFKKLNPFKKKKDNDD
ncbi:MAG: serine/threonine-protein kinase [Acidobacteriota bacterium]